MAGLRKIHSLDPRVITGLSDELLLGEGCDLCGRKIVRIPFVPEIIKRFFEIEYLCEWCRDTINRVQREQAWPICWSATPDDEIKWFLVELVLEQFKMHFERSQFSMFWECCVEGCHARRAPVKPEPYKWPVYEQENDLEDFDLETIDVPVIRRTHLGDDVSP